MSRNNKAGTFVNLLIKMSMFIYEGLARNAEEIESQQAEIEENGNTSRENAEEKRGKHRPEFLL